MQPGIVTSDRLRSMKCPVCGSKDKNTSCIANEKREDIIKIMACNQCGHVTLFGVSAMAVTDLLTGGVNNLATREHYEFCVRCQHEGNHPD